MMKAVSTLKRYRTQNVRSHLLSTEITLNEHVELLASRHPFVARGLGTRHLGGLFFFSDWLFLIFISYIEI